MDDMTHCPVCNNKLTVRKVANKYLHHINHTSDSFYIKKECVKNAHYLVFYVNSSSKKVDFVKLSIDAKYSIYLEIDYHNNVSRIICCNNQGKNIIHINQVLDLDFYNMMPLINKINMYLYFS